MYCMRYIRASVYHKRDGGLKSFGWGVFGVVHAVPTSAALMSTAPPHDTRVCDRFSVILILAVANDCGGCIKSEK